MNIKRVILSIGTAILLFPQTSHAQTSSPKPKIGYLLPAGGQHGTTVKIMLGGARITNSPEILVQDKGIRAKVEHACTTPRTERPRANERAAMRQAVDLAKRGAAITGELRDRLNDRPLLWPLRNPKLKPTQDEMQRITYEYLTDRQRVQASRDLAQTVLISLAIPANTKPGRHELRLRTPFGISDPFYFFVGQCPETLETEPGTEQQPMAPPLRLPICINGQIFPGDIDRYRFQAKAGQTLSLTAAARELKPFIADAVPGWFEAMITLYDPKGKEAAFSDCTQFRPDPTLVYTVPHDGVYTVELRDSLYRGRRDFVYRLTLQERPQATARTFTHTLASPESVNTHSFDAKKGRAVIIRTEARIYGSPMDTFVQVADVNGRVLAQDDDASAPFNVGLQTAFTDSYLKFTPPADGTYRALITDTEQQGGSEYGYELIIAPPDPGFDLYVTPSVITIGAGYSAPITFHVRRRDGFEGEIKLRLDGTSHGFDLDQATIPAGQHAITVVLNTPSTRIGREDRIALKFSGGANGAGVALSVPAIPADDWEQAFIYHHLVPTDSFQVSLNRPRGRPVQFTLAQQAPLRLDPARPTVVRMQSRLRQPDRALQFRLLHAPKGVSLTKSTFSNGRLELLFSSEKKIAECGNLVVEMLVTRTVTRAMSRDGGRLEIQQSMGVLPAIAYTP